MSLVTVVACVLAAFLQGLNGEMVATQTPDSLSVTLGETVKLNCETSSGSNCDFTLTISGAPPEDEADYYYHVANPLTFGRRSTLEIKRLNGEMVATQTPDSLSVTRGEGVKLNCKISSGLNCDFTLTITGVLREDDAYNYYQVANPLTFGRRTTLEIKHESSNNLFRRKRLAAYKKKNGLNGGIVVTHSPDFLSVTRGEGVKINCKMSNGSNCDFTLTISGALVEDEKDYYCQVVNPLNFRSRTTLEIKQKPDSAPSMFNSMNGKPLLRQGQTTSNWVTCKKVRKGMEQQQQQT